MLWLPNALTIARTIAILPIAALLFWPVPEARWIALVIFVAACITDFLDGWLARRWKATTVLGRLLDPIADKVLVGALIVMLVGTGDAPAIPAMLIIFRELLVSGLREHLAGHAVVLPVTQVAKWKTTAQMVALAFLIPGAGGPVLAEGISTFDIGQVLFWLAAALTVFTGWTYLVASVRRMRDEPAP
jgi:cardiolipin synthase (CMP-forming)